MAILVSCSSGSIYLVLGLLQQTLN